MLAGTGQGEVAARRWESTDPDNVGPKNVRTLTTVPTGSAADAMHAVSRLLASALDAAGPAVVQGALVSEARQLFGVSSVFLLSVEPHEHLARVVAYDSEEPPAAARIPTTELPSLEDLWRPHSELRGSQLHLLGRELGMRTAPGFALSLPMRARDATDHLLVLADADLEHAVRGERAELAAAFAAAAASGLAQLRLVEEQAARTAQQAALARAAKTLNETLDLPAVLSAICSEARAILDGDSAAAYIGGRDGPLTIESAIGLAEGNIGRTMTPGEGLSGRVALADRAMLTNDYQRIAQPQPDSPFTSVQSCLAVPMHWDSVLRGVLSVGFTRARFVSAQDLALLEAFGEIAAAACRNASAAAGLALAARTDGLTGCLNHAAMQDALAREIKRAQRSAQDISVVLLDLDDFKQVNEREGHLVGDEVLRRVGQALRVATRPYDVVARYGGDEFAIIAIDADEATAHEIATRAIERVHAAMVALGRPVGAVATAGVAQRAEGLDGAMLLEEADRALLYGKQVEGRGQAVRASAIPDDYRPRTHGLAPNAPGRMVAAAPRGHELAPRRPQPALEAVSETGEHQQLAKRTRHLMLANALGARLAAMTDSDDITAAAVEELHREFGFYLCAAVRIDEDDSLVAAATSGVGFQRLAPNGWTQPRDAGIIGRALRERTVVLCNDVTKDPNFCVTGETTETRSELVAPVCVGERLWGALNIEEARLDAFDDDDARLLESVADQVGSALRSAELYAQLERAYLGTAEALAAALEAKDAYTAQHATSIVAWAEAIGRRLGMDNLALRNLRYGAIFHDIGKIAVPEGILNKPGPLTAEEWAIVQRHTVVGEQILAPVEFLSDVLPIVRHEHENWDGSGYPDGLRGMSIPLGARIVLVCDAYHAMTSDRPYRPGLGREKAMGELLEHAGAQFDPLVVDALLAILAGEDTDAFPVAALRG